MKVNFSVVIPTYKNKNLFLNNLKNNYPYLVGGELIIVNDDPKEKIREEIEFLINQQKNKKINRLIILENEKNLGFGESVNRGVLKSNSDFILLLNSDVRLKDDSFKRGLDDFKINPRLFAISFAQKEKNGKVVGKNIFFWKRGMFFHSQAKNMNFGFNAWFEGGAALIDKKKFLNLGGYDNIYSPFYWEDIDISYRGYKRGWQIIFDPSIIVEHHHQSTISKYFTSSFTETIAFRNQLIFIWKNIVDIKLIFIHFIFIPYYFLYFFLKRKKEFFLGFLKALFHLKKIIKKRKQEKNQVIIGDKIIMNFFKN